MEQKKSLSKIIATIVFGIVSSLLLLYLVIKAKQ